MPLNREFSINNDVGLHARPAAQFVKLASRFGCDLTIENLTNGKGPANAKSIMNVLACGVERGHRIRVTADGDDADAALDALENLIGEDFSLPD